MFSKTTLAVSAALIASGAFASRYDGTQPYGVSWGLVDAQCGTGDYWPFRKVVSCSNGNGYSLRNNVPIVYSDSPLTFGNTQYGDDADKRTYTTSPLWAPEQVYQTEVYGASTVVFTGLTPNALYKVESHVAETYNAGQNRIWRTQVNGSTLMVCVKPGSVAGLGGACNFSAEVYADADGRLTFVNNNYSDNGLFCGYAVWGMSAPTWENPSIVGTGADVVITWSNAKDVHRYYVESAESENGPWTNEATVLPEATSATMSGKYNPLIEKWWRVVASNGVGTVEQKVKLGDSSAVTYTELASRGETVASDATANYRVSTAGTGAVNALGSTTTEAAMYVGSVAEAHTLAIADGETLKVGQLGMASGAGDMTIGDTVGQGSVVPQGGQLTLDVKDAASTLTVNAPVTKQSGTDSIVKYGEGRAVLAGGTDVANLSLGGGALVIPNASDATFSKSLSGNSTFVKTGAGKLTLDNSASCSSFVGTFEVGEGVALLGRDKMYDFMNESATVKVDSGATFDIGNPNASNDNDVQLRGIKVVFEGTGAPGAGGALVNSSSRSQYSSLTHGALSGDGTVYANGRFDFRSNNGGEFELNGHTLTKAGNGSFYFTSIPVRAGAAGAQIRAEAGTIGAESSTTFDGSGSFVLANNAAFDFYNIGAPIAWPLLIEATGGKFTCRSGNYDNNNNWAGQVTIAEGGTFSVAANDSASLRVTGKITGAGKLRRAEGGSTAYVKIENANNDWTGGTEVNYGILFFPYAAALSQYDQPGKVEISGTGRLAVKVGDGGTGGWNAEQIATLVANVTAPSDSKGLIVIDTNGMDIESGEGVIDKPIGIGKTGGGTYTAQMTYPSGGGVYVDQGVLKIDNGGYNKLESVQVIKSGTLVVENSEIDCGDNDTHVANVSSTDHARMVLGDGAYYHTVMKPYQTASHGLYISTAENSFGILEVQDNAVISNRIGLGQNKGCSGAVYQRGGEIVNWAGHGGDGRLANGERSYGYWEVGGGDTYFMGYSQLGYHTSGAGILAVKGGAFHQRTELGGDLALSRGGTGVVYVASGSFDSVADVMMGENNDNGGRGGAAVFTVAGGTVNLEADNANHDARNLFLSDRDSFFAEVNLNGGELAAGCVSKKSAKSGTSAYVTFNGGTLKSKIAGKAIFGDNADTQPDAVYVYNRGAIFDTDGKNTSTLVPLQAPEGNGVLKISYEADNMIGPPLVTISGGGGQGATAIADFDSESGKVNGIIVTCPGWGYTATPTVTISGGGLKFDSPVTLDPSAVTMGESSSGPLVKKGEGTLTLAGDNGFVGVEVAGGVLSAPPGVKLQRGPLTLSGGSIFAPSFDATEVIVNGDADTVSELGAKLTVNGERMSARKPGLYRHFEQSEGLRDVEATEENHDAVVISLDYVNTEMANNAVVEGFLNQNLNCSYDGYIWNRSDDNVTWTFAEHFDDYVLLKIDDTTVLEDINAASSPWTRPTLGTIVLTPGPHRFHLVVNQGGGTSGPCVNTAWYSWWTRNMDENDWALGVDFNGNNAEEYTNFVKLVDPGDGSLFTLTADEYIMQDFAPSAAVHVNGGTLKLLPSQLGLAGGFVPNGTYRSASCPATGVFPDLRYANMKFGDTVMLDDTINVVSEGGQLNKEIDYVFEGFIWNHGEESVTWTFAENFDDSVYLTIDGAVVLNNDNWDRPTIGTVTLSPGPHSIRIGLHQGTGGSGPSEQGWLNDSSIGIGIDFQGRAAESAACYVPLNANANNDELPLLTTMPYLSGEQQLPSDASLAVSGSGVIDLNGGDFTVNELYSGDAGFVNGGLTIDGTWTVDVADLSAGCTLSVKSLDLTEATLSLTGDFDELDNTRRYVLASSTDGIVGSPALSAELPRGWIIRARGDKLVLMYSTGTMFYLR